MTEFRPFKPADGVESARFEAVFCENCAKHNRARICPILFAAGVSDPTDPFRSNGVLATTGRNARPMSRN
jgi:hypothetical protein